MNPLNFVLPFGHCGRNDNDTISDIVAEAQSQQRLLFPMQTQLQTWAKEQDLCGTDSLQYYRAPESELRLVPNQRLDLQQWCETEYHNDSVVVCNIKKTNVGSLSEDHDAKRKQKRHMPQQVPLNNHDESNYHERAIQLHQAGYDDEATKQKTEQCLIDYSDRSNIFSIPTPSEHLNAPSFYQTNHASRWFIHTQRNLDVTNFSSKITYTFPPLFPAFRENEATNKSWKKTLIAFGTALALPDMKQEAIIAGKIRLVMALQESDCYWAEQLYRTEPGRSGLFRVAQIACWANTESLDKFRLGEKSSEWRNNYLDMAIPGSYDGAHYRNLRNPFFQQLTNAINLLKINARDKEKNNNVNDAKTEQEECCDELTRVGQNEKAMNKRIQNKIGYSDEESAKANNSIANPRFAQKPAYAVFIDICRKKYSREKGADEGQDAFSKDRFMNLLYASEACTVQEKGCLRYMILIKLRRQQQQGKTKGAKTKKREDRDKAQYTVYAVFANEDAFNYHSSQGYSVLSDRFKELCAPLYPATTAYTRNTI